MNIPAGKFKAKCPKYIDQVNETHEVLVITKHGKPKAKLTPVSEEPKQLFGSIKGSAEIVGDIVSSTGAEWEADK